MSDERGPIGFAEKVLELLEEGRYTSTYKYAVLVALMDLCLEHTQASGAPPEIVRTREIAEKIVEIYWPHTVPFGERDPQAQVLRQNSGGQLEVLTAIARFRARHAPDAATSWQGRSTAPAQFAELVGLVEWKLVEMPLPLLQRMGAASEDFIYEIGWSGSITKKMVERRGDGEGGAFDGRLRLKPGVGEYLLQLNGLLRPLIHRRWCAKVAQLNRREDSRLEEFLFGAERVPTVRVRAGLWEIQAGRCFYCGGRVGDPRSGHVDHFIPWARYPDNGIENLVVADAPCNANKGSSLAAGEHLARWALRLSSGAGLAAQLAELAGQTGWDRHAQRTGSVARGIYLGLPEGARLWLRRQEFVLVDRAEVRRALASAA